jgi:N-acetylglucosamine-6-sulfatase
MKQTQKLIAKNGATASNWFIHTPVCCPSRAELLSGRYMHSIRMPTPKGGCMHIDETKVNPVSYGRYLGEAGYTVGYFG